MLSEGPQWNGLLVLWWDKQVLKQATLKKIKKKKYSASPSETSFATDWPASEAVRAKAIHRSAELQDTKRVRNSLEGDYLHLY